MREWYSLDGGRMERKIKQRDILIERVRGLGRHDTREVLRNPQE